MEDGMTWCARDYPQEQADHMCVSVQLPECKDILLTAARNAMQHDRNLYPKQLSSAFSPVMSTSPQLIQLIVWNVILTSQGHSIKWF